MQFNNKNRSHLLLKLLVSLLLFFTAEKYASCSFALSYNPFPLHKSLITQVELKKPVYFNFDLFTNSVNHVLSHQAFSFYSTAGNFLALINNHKAAALSALRSIVTHTVNNTERYRMDIRKSNLPPVAC